MTRFVVCLDGTWNNAAREVERADGSRVYRPTNVLKLARAVKRIDDHAVAQITYYDTGVGSMNRAPSGAARIVRGVDNALGGMLGAGFEVNIEEAYSFLANNWTEGDELFVFGFSRGAAQARSLVRLIGCVGGFPVKSDAYYAPTLFTRYLGSCGKLVGAEFWEWENARREKDERALLSPIVPARVRFLGVWDTVLSLGSRLTPFWANGVEGDFHVPAVSPANVDRIRHALAIDERRHDFQAAVFDATSADVEQKWFAGVHSNVGGGLNEDGLANCALAWMVREACEAGLAVDEEFLKHFRPFPMGRESAKTTMFAVVDTMLTPWRGFKGERDLLAVEGMTLDDSVFARLNADPVRHPKAMDGPYRPRNLLRYLKAHPELRDRLSEAVREAVDAT